MPAGRRQLARRELSDRNRGMRRRLGLLAFVLTCGLAPHDELGARASDVAKLQALFERELCPRLSVPAAEQHEYVALLRQAFAIAGIVLEAPQFVLMIDRSPVVQAAFILFLDAASVWHMVAATPAATGRPGAYEYFLTPLGVFAHTTDNMDYRALGTRNALGVRGYGVKGMRVYDFGWVPAERGWGKGGVSPMRLQVHATDPDLLEHLLGAPRSKGCIRIPASLNVMLDRYGVLDADYDAALAQGRSLPVLRTDREPVGDAGRYLVVVESMRAVRPAWSPAPPHRTRACAATSSAERGAGYESAPRVR